MKKPLAIILAFFIVFSPVYSYAVLPALIASAASAAGRVLVGNGVKKVSQTALSRAGMGIVGLCKKNPLQCVGIGVGILGLLDKDGFTVDIGGEGDTTNNINIEIYKIPPSDTCEFQYAFTENGYYSNNYQGYYASYIAKKAISPSDAKPADNWEQPFLSQIALAEQSSTSSTIQTTWKYFGSVTFPYSFKSESSTYFTNYNSSINFYIRCMPYPTNKVYLTENEFYNYLQQNISADDIKNIYNYDYSQHPNITINNNSYGGNTINNDLSVSAEPEFKVSPSLKLDIESNKVNLDNVNDENCTKNEAGEYDKCGDTEEPTDPENPDPDTPVPPEPSPIECDANGFYKKVCDWMNWTQKPHTEPTTTNVVVVDKTSDIVIDDSRIRFNDQCPSPKDINLTVAGHSFSEFLDYQPLCDFFTQLHPFVVGIGGVSTALIIAGGVRRG